MKCAWSTPEGASCDAEALSGKTLCWFHDPGISEARAEARARGGRASRASQRPTGIKVDVSTPAAALATLDAVGKALAAGQCDRGTANALAIIAKNALEAHKAVSYEKDVRRIKRALDLDQDPLGDEEDGHADRP